MEKASMELEFEEWELLPENNHTFLDSGLDSFVDMNYFICPLEARKKSSIPVSERKEDPTVAKKVDDGLNGEFMDIGAVPPPPVIVADRDLISQVFFKKLKEDEFADMKVDSPKSNTKGIAVPGPINLFEEEEEEDEVGDQIEGKKPRWEGVGFRILRWRIMGVGALCSMGVAAAATICIFMLGGGRRLRQQSQSQRLQFQIYTDNQRIKQGVQQAVRLNQAISAVRGVPMTWARISFGGYYDGL